MLARRAAYLAWLLAAPALLPAVGRADDATEARTAESAADSVDDELLDYLGSVDAEGPEWMDYLTHTDGAQSAQLKPPSAGSKEQEK